MRSSSYEALVWTGEPFDYPTLYIDDVSDIPFLVDISGVEEYQHRARVRAGDGDLFAAVTPPVVGYESYCRDVLGMGRPELVQAEPVGPPIAVARACAEGEAFRRITRRAREAGGLLVHPYMSIEPVWELARRVSREASVPVQVQGPPPPVTWLANDKKRFSELVEDVLGAEWLVRMTIASTPGDIAGNLLALAGEHPRVGLKRTRCASAMGNEVFDSDGLMALGRVGVEKIARRFLERTEWDGEEDVLAVVWEETDLSPSTQTWIPPAGKGEPVVEGIYEQILEGPGKIFVGSRPARLDVNERLAEASLRVASALQGLGYVGRCSFDFLVLSEGRVVFTECNGRWGGTSIPMSMVDRLVGSPRPPYRAQDVVHPGLVGASFEEVLEAAGDVLYDAKTGEGTYIFYNVGPLERSGKIDVIALGATQGEAEHALTEELPKRLGLDPRKKETGPS